MKFIDGILFGMGFLLGIIIMAVIINFLADIGLVGWISNYYSDLATKVKDIIAK